MMILLTLILLLSPPAPPVSPAAAPESSYRSQEGSRNRQTARSSTPRTEKELLDGGLEAEAAGEFEKALSIWLLAKSDLEVPSLSIAAHYLRLVTEQELNAYHRAAWGMYVWGLTAEEVPPNREALEREIELLAPLAADSLAVEWQALLQREDPALYRELQRWWRQVDPTPATPYNERVVEHGERLAHIREEYGPEEAESAPPGSRAEAYLRYGAPDRVHSGRLWIRSGDVCLVLRMRLTIEGSFADCSSWGVRNMESHVMELADNPRYEIWIYDSGPLLEHENLVLIFGEAEGEGLRRRETVDEMIPSRASYPSRRYSYQGVSPGIVIQWLYYDQLASVDPYFSDRFSRLDFRFMRREDPELQQYLTTQLRLEHAHQARRERSRTPQQFSTHLRNLPSIPVEVHQYRLLDEANRPIFATFMNSRPQQAFLRDFTSNQDSMMPETRRPIGAPPPPPGDALQEAFASYSLHHGMELRSADGERLTGERFQPVLILDGNDMQVTSGSAFTVPYVSRNTEQLFYAELHNDHPVSSPRYRSPLPDYMRGMGRAVLPQPEPLDADPGQLQMGELILGYRMRESADSTSFLPFVVSHDRIIPDGERPAVHFEVYHLQEDERGLRDFTVDYEILPVNFLGWTREGKDDLGLTLFFEHDRSRFSENLEIEAADLTPGRYVLRLRVTDRASGQEAYREVHFRVAEKAEAE